MSNLEELPNIGPELAKRLTKSGVATREQFEALGDEESFRRLCAAFPEDACIHTRLALAGAARRVRWHSLDAALRKSLTAGLKV